MKIQLLGTMKGLDRDGKKKTWAKGHIFDDADGKIPSDIMIALRNKSPLIGVVPEISKPGTQSETVAVSNKQLNSTLDDLKTAQEKIAGLKDEVLELKKKNEVLKDEILKLKNSIEKEKLNNMESKEETTPPSLKDEHRCVLCGRVFDSAQGLNMHTIKAHPNKD